MMFEQFMKMDAPAAFAIVGFTLAISAAFVAVVIRRQAERNARRKYELDRIEVAARSKLIEHKRES